MLFWLSQPIFSWHWHNFMISCSHSAEKRKIPLYLACLETKSYGPFGVFLQLSKINKDPFPARISTNDCQPNYDKFVVWITTTLLSIWFWFLTDLPLLSSNYFLRSTFGRQTTKNKVFQIVSANDKNVKYNCKLVISTHIELRSSIFRNDTLK